MSVKTIDDLGAFAGRLIDFQVVSLPSSGRIIRRGRILKVSSFPEGSVIQIDNTLQFDPASRRWSKSDRGQQELDLRSIEGRRNHLQPIELPDGTVEIVLLDGRYAAIHPAGATFPPEPLTVSFSFSDFLATVC